MKKFIPACHFAPSQGDAAFAVSKQLTFGAGAVFSRSANWEIGPVLDQGFSQECLAYGFKGFMAAEPFSVDVGDPDHLYREMCKIDGRQHSPVDSGSSLQAALKICQANGYFASYLWCQNATEVWQFLTDPTHGGPVGFAFPWIQQMELLRDDGTLNVPDTINKNDVLGGHFTFLCGCKNDQGTDTHPLRFRGVNSRGTAWGQGGKFWLDFYDLSNLLDFGALAVAPTKAKFDAK